ncbi:hypothetical protein EDC01DRAFT_785971 [Geopyxis carbonaria]|nr:hypothetical protein EDC01DRAFT_785971 [Geopyxis carbonaria]
MPLGNFPNAGTFLMKTKTSLIRTREGELRFGKTNGYSGSDDDPDQMSNSDADEDADQQSDGQPEAEPGSNSDADAPGGSSSGEAEDPGYSDSGPTGHGSQDGGRRSGTVFRAAQRPATPQNLAISEEYPTPQSMRKVSNKHLLGRETKVRRSSRDREVAVRRYMLRRAKRGTKTTVTIRLYRPVLGDPAEPVPSRRVHHIMAKDRKLVLPPP